MDCISRALWCLVRSGKYTEFVVLLKFHTRSAGHNATLAESVQSSPRANINMIAAEGYQAMGRGIIAAQFLSQCCGHRVLLLRAARAALVHLAVPGRRCAGRVLGRVGVGRVRS